MAGRRGNGGFGSFVAGIVFTIVILCAGVYVYLHYGHPPVAVSDKPFPYEATIVRAPLHARIESQLEMSPLTATHENLLEGARLYVTQCAFCHGTPGHTSNIGSDEYPSAPQLWQPHGKHGVVGVSDDETGETYWRVKNGIRLTGMPSYEKRWTTQQMWQVSLLVKNADKPLDPDVAAVLASSGPTQPSTEFK